MKPDLIINGMTSMDDLIELFEKKGGDETKLYTLQTVLDYLMKLGIPEAGNIILTDMIAKGEL